MNTVHCASLDERVCWEQVTGGLQVYVMPKPGWRRSSALLAIDFGALDRSLWWHDGTGPLALPAGVAHFLEHRLFAKRGGDIAERFGALGAEVDADTAFTHTGFSCACRGACEPSLELLFELAFTACLDERGVRRERDIIAHEIQLSADELDWIGYFRALETVFPGQPLAEDIAGSLESLAGIGAPLLRRCHQTMYRAASASLFVCGDVDPGAVVRLAERQLARYPRAAAPPPGGVRRQPVTPGPARRTVSSLPVARPHLTLAFGDPRPGPRGPALLARELALELALYAVLGPGSAFCRDGYEAGLIDAGSFGVAVNFEPTFGVCLLSGETTAPAVLEEAVLRALERAGRSGLDPEDIELARRRNWGGLVRAWEDPDTCVEAMHSAVDCGAEPFDFVSVHQQVALADAEASLHECLQPACCGVSVILPEAVPAGARPGR